MRRPLTVTAILALGLAACSDDGGSGDDTAFTTANDETATDTDGESGSTDSGTTSTTDSSTDDTTSDSTDGTDSSTDDTTDGTESSTDTTESSTDTTTTTDGTDTDGTTTGNMVVPCDVAEADLEPLIPHVMLVLDKSGSMLDNTWDHDNDPNTAEVTRWNSLHSVVSLMTNGFGDKLDFGAQLYPSTSATNEYNINACLVNSPPEVPVGPNNGVQILLNIPIANSQNIRGGTPATYGMTSAIDHLTMIDDGDPASIVLVTDGAANCSPSAGSNTELFEVYDADLLPTVTDAFTNLDIPTYVVGIDISNEVTMMVLDGEPDGISPYAQLNELATAGGKPKDGMEAFYQTNNQIELEAALQAIVDDAISCTILLDPVPLFPELLEIVMDDEVIPKVTDCNSEDGWVFTDPNDPTPDSVELCGTWCGAVPDANIVKAEYYCEPG